MYLYGVSVDMYLNNFAFESIEKRILLLHSNIFIRRHIQSFKNGVFAHRITIIHYHILRKIGMIFITFETGFYQVQKVAAAFQ